MIQNITRFWYNKNGKPQKFINRKVFSYKFLVLVNYFLHFLIIWFHYVNSLNYILIFVCADCADCAVKNVFS